MPELSNPHNPNPPPIWSKRLPCPVCRKEMGLDRIKPHPRFINAHIRLFKCECGGENSDIVTLAL